VSDTSHNAVVLVSGITVTGPVAISGGTISGGASASTLQISSGSIYGALDARDGAIQTLRNSLDSLASQIVTSVNAAYNPTSAAGGNFFNPAGTTAATINLSSSLSATNLTAGTGAAGDNTIALAVAGVANQQFSTAGGDAIDGTIDQYYSGAVTDLGQTLSNVNNEVTNQNALLNLVTSQRDSVSGVSMDQEMGNLMKYQSAYQASARVFSTIDVLLNTLINNTGTP
jgi:flagellar hook-associated protein 1 FlgK